MKFEIDMDAMEQRRYDEIKASGKYLEFDVLIGHDETHLINGTKGKMPVVTTAFNGANGEDIACLYATLGAYMQELEKQYPAECIMSKIGMNLVSLETFETPREESEED